jgi:hypothetical protein
LWGGGGGLCSHIDPIILVVINFEHNSTTPTIFLFRLV